MDLIMTDFEKIISFDSLYNAHRRARLSKRHKKEVVQFEMNLSQNLYNLHYDLKFNKYKISGYHNFKIYDPKERLIQAISYKDRVLQHSLCDNYLMPLIETKLIYDNAACRKNKGTHFIINRLKGFMRAHYKNYDNGGYFIKIDIKKYFDSINHSLLKSKLKEIVNDSNILSLLFEIIDSYNFSFDCGLPMGNQTSQCFALLYLDSVDKYIKHNLKIKYYVRYMDDMILIVKDKQFAVEIFNKIKIFIESHSIEINSKSQIIAFKNGIEFLGWRFFVNKNGKVIQKLRKSTKKRINDKIKSKFNNKNFNLTVVSYKGFLLHGNAFLFYKRLFF